MGTVNPGVSPEKPYVAPPTGANVTETENSSAEIKSENGYLDTTDGVGQSSGASYNQAGSIDSGTPRLPLSNEEAEVLTANMKSISDAVKPEVAKWFEPAFVSTFFEISYELFKVLQEAFAVNIDAMVAEIGIMGAQTQEKAKLRKAIGQKEAASLKMDAYNAFISAGTSVVMAAATFGTRCLAKRRHPDSGKIKELKRDVKDLTNYDANKGKLAKLNDKYQGVIPDKKIATKMNRLQASIENAEKKGVKNIGLSSNKRKLKDIPDPLTKKQAELNQLVRKRDGDIGQSMHYSMTFYQAVKQGVDSLTQGIFNIIKAESDSSNR